MKLVSTGSKWEKAYKVFKMDNGLFMIECYYNNKLNFTRKQTNSSVEGLSSMKRLYQVINWGVEYLG